MGIEIPQLPTLGAERLFPLDSVGLGMDTIISLKVLRENSPREGLKLCYSSQAEEGLLRGRFRLLPVCGGSQRCLPFLGLFRLPFSRKGPRGYSLFGQP